MWSMSVEFAAARRWRLELWVCTIAGLACSSLFGCENASPGTSLPPSTALATVGSAVSSGSPSSAHTPEQRSLGAPYSPARWRLTNPQALTFSALPVSHILVRYRGVSSRAGLFYSPLPWTPEPSPPERSREEAYALAERVSQQAMSSRASFADLAAQYSEDVTTRNTGGTLGAVRADSLYDWPQVLDALAALSPGQVSRPVETECGFHVLRLGPPPKPQIVSGRHLVISYNEAPWLKAFMGIGNTPSRSRTEAQRLARELYEQALAAPDSWLELIRAHSEHQDAWRDGDLGDWSTAEISPYPRTIARLQALAIGEIAAPLETFYGFEIVQRVVPRDREWFSMEAIKHQVDPDAAPGEPNSASAVQSELQRIADEVRRDPSQFAVHQARLCCANHVESWSAGRGSVPAERELERLKLGEVAAAPTAIVPTLYALLRRVPVVKQPTAVTHFSLPAPEDPDVPFILAMTDQTQTLAGVQRQALGELGLDAVTRAQFSRVHEELLAWNDWDSIDNRYGRVQQFQSQLEELLGAVGYAQYAGLLHTALEEQLLSPGAAPFSW